MLYEEYLLDALQCFQNIVNISRADRIAALPTNGMLPIQVIAKLLSDLITRDKSHSRINESL